jgi:hypothetical protein
MANSRTFTAIFQLSDYFSTKYEGIQKKIKGLTDTTHDVQIGADTSSAMKKTEELGRSINSSIVGQSGKSTSALSMLSASATGAFDRVTQATNRAGGAVTSIRGKFQNAFGDIKSTISDTGNAISELAGSVAMIGAGGAVAGFSYLEASQSQLKVDSIVRAIDQNKRFNVSNDQLQEAVANLQTPGSTNSKTSELYGIITAGTKYMGKGQKAIDKATAISQFGFANQEAIEAQGFDGIQEIIGMALEEEGALTGEEGMKFQIATGLSNAEMATAQTRLKALVGKGLKVDIQSEIDKRPWIEMQASIDSLQSNIGKATTGTIAPFIKGIAAIVTKISEIPGAPGLIGMVAMLTAGAGATSLLISVFTPLYALLSKVGVATKVMNALEWASVTVKTALTGTNAAQATSYALSTGAIGMEAEALAADTAAQNVGIIAKARSTAANGINTISHYVSSAALWGRSAATGALTIVTGLLTGQMTVNTAAMMVWNGVVAIGTTLMGGFDAALFAPLLLLGALVAVIAIVAYKTGALGAAWKELSKINFGGAWQDILSGNYDKALRKVEKGIGKAGDAFKTKILVGIDETIGGTLEDPLGSIQSVLEGTYRWTSKAFPFVEKISGYSEKARNWLEWLYNLIKSVWSWLMNAIPGAAKEEARQTLNTDVGRTNKQTAVYDVTYDYSLKKFRAYNTSISNPAPVEIGSLSDLATYIGSGRAKKLWTEAKTYEDKPSFAQGIAEAVKEGLSGFLTGLEDTIKDALQLPEVSFPSIDDLVGILTSLVDSLVRLEKAITVKLGLGGSGAGGSGWGGLAGSGEAVYNSLDGRYTYTWDTSASTVAIKDWNGSLGTNTPVSVVDFSSLDQDVQDALNSEAKNLQTHAVGATFKSTGVYTGKFHEREEVIPQALATKGPGPISRAMADLYDLDNAGSGSRNLRSGGEIHVHIHNDPKFDFAGARFDASFDVDAFLKKATDQMKDVAVKAVKDQIGQRTC